MRTLKVRIIWMILLLVGCSVWLTGIFVALLLKNSYVDSLSIRLSKEAEMIARTIDWKELTNSNKIHDEIEIYEDTLDVRVTLVDSQGNVLSDSEMDPKEMDNQQVHKEINNALHSDQLISYTERRNDYLHAAFPIVQEGEVYGAVRLTFDLNVVNNTLLRVWVSLVGGLILAYALAAFASSRIASSIAKPLEEMTQVAVDITQKRFHRRVQIKGSDEVARLGYAINRMAHRLQKQLNTIRQSERRLFSVIESLESGLVMVDDQGTIRFANRSFERMFGQSVDQLKNQSYQDLLYPYDLSSLIENCMKTEQTIRKEISLHHPDEKNFEISLTPIVEKNGVGVVLVLHDLTAIRHLEQMRKDFVANVSHELKTPITSIRGFSETLLDGDLSELDMSREFLQIIHDESIRLQRLIGDLLDLSRIESKKMKMSVKATPVDELVQSVVKTIEDQIRVKHQTLSIRVEDSFQVEVDVDSFRQILLNLLSNAISYTPEEGKIEVIAYRHGNEWTLIVKDTGIGIPEQDQSRIFERFYRVDKDRSRESGGTGLGLAITKHLIEVHQGRIQVKSRVGKGTEFHLTFPIQLQMDSE